MNTIKFAKKFAIPLFVALAYGPASGLAVPLIEANLATFAVLGGAEVTNVPTSTIVGNVGVSTGVSMIGFGTSTPLAAHSDTQVTSGLVHETDALANSAHAQLVTTYLNLAGLGGGTPVDGSTLGGKTLTSGVYTLGAADLTGTLTLNAQGNADAFWVFQIASSLTTASGSKVVMLSDDVAGSFAPVFWQVTSSATLGTTTEFIGHIAALTSITMNTGATIDCGSAWARNGTVSLDSNKITTGCNNLEFTAGEGGGGGSVSVTPIPEPETYAMLLAGLGVMGFVARRRQRNLAAAA